MRTTLVLLCALIATGCGARSINDVLADPAKYRDKSVTVHGTVENAVSAAGRGVYRITDGGQGLWVVTTSGAPRNGARVDVTGRLQDGYDFAGLGGLLKLPAALQSGIVLIESSHKARN